MQFYLQNYLEEKSVMISVKHIANFVFGFKSSSHYLKTSFDTSKEIYLNSAAHLCLYYCIV